jgi:hypothetical protein
MICQCEIILHHATEPYSSLYWIKGKTLGLRLSREEKLQALSPSIFNEGEDMCFVGRWLSSCVGNVFGYIVHAFSFYPQASDVGLTHSLVLGTVLALELVAFPWLGPLAHIGISFVSYLLRHSNSLLQIWPSHIR